MFSEKSIIDGNNVSCKFKGKTLSKRDRAVKSCTFARNPFTTPNKSSKDDLNHDNKIKSSKSCNIPKVSRSEYISPYKMNVYQQNTANPVKNTETVEKTETVKQNKNKLLKKQTRKLGLKKYTRSKVDENEFFEKVYCIQNRICSLIVEIKRGLYEQILEPDGREDLARREKCEHEFWCRFTRNFNSELGRQMRVFFRLVQTKPRTSSIISFSQRRVLTIHQILFQSLSSYIAHLPMSLSNELNVNVKNIIEQFMIVLKLCTEHKLCNNLPKLPASLSTLLSFREEDKKILMSNYKEMKPLKTDSARRKEPNSMKRLSMYLDRPGQYKMLSKSGKRSTKTRSSKKTAHRQNLDNNKPVTNDEDIVTLVSLIDNNESTDEDKEDDPRLQEACFHMGNLISDAIDYKNALKSMLSQYSKHFVTGRKQWEVATLLMIQLINETIIDMTTWNDEQIIEKFSPDHRQ